MMLRSIIAGLVMYGCFSSSSLCFAQNPEPKTPAVHKNSETTPPSSPHQSNKPKDKPKKEESKAKRKLAFPDSPKK